MLPGLIPGLIQSYGMAIRYTIGIEKITLSKRGFKGLVQDLKKLISRISNAEGGMGNGWIEYLSVLRKS